MHVTCPDVNSSAPKKSEFGDYNGNVDIVLNNLTKQPLFTFLI